MRVSYLLLSFESSTKNEEFLKQYICQLNLNNYENQMKETFNQGIEKNKVDIIKEMLKEKSTS